MNALPYLGDGDLVDLSNLCTRERMVRLAEKGGAVAREFDPSWLPEVHQPMHGGAVAWVRRDELIYGVAMPSGEVVTKNALLESARTAGDHHDQRD